MVYRLERKLTLAFLYTHSVVPDAAGLLQE